MGGQRKRFYFFSSRYLGALEKYKHRDLNGQPLLLRVFMNCSFLLREFVTGFYVIGQWAEAPSHFIIVTWFIRGMKEPRSSHKLFRAHGWNVTISIIAEAGPSRANSHSALRGRCKKYFAYLQHNAANNADRPQQIALFVHSMAGGCV